MQDAKRPDQTFFDDPAIDRLLGAVMTLAAELHVTRDHVRVLEKLLVDKGVLGADEVAAFTPDAATAAGWDAERDAFVANLMGALQGMTHARDPESS